MPSYTHQIPADPPSIRVDAYATSVFVALPSRAQARKAIKAGRLLVDGAPCRSAWFVRAGNTLTLTVPDTSRFTVMALPLTICHADPWLAVVHKPAGIHVRGNYARTIERAMRHNLPLSALPDALPDPDPVHRLDYRTSGLLLIARSALARVKLGQMFEERRIFKRYRAVVLGRLEGSGELDAPLDGRAALTRYQVVGHTRSLRTGWLTEVDLFPVTGRTHQLRRHMAGIGHAILGDDLHTSGPIFRGCGLFLCAVEQRLTHPFTDAPLQVQIPPPAKFTTHFARESRRWHRWHAEE